jgi:hypothetical protein
MSYRVTIFLCKQHFATHGVAVRGYCLLSSLRAFSSSRFFASSIFG